LLSLAGILKAARERDTVELLADNGEGDVGVADADDKNAIDVGGKHEVGETVKIEAAEDAAIGMADDKAVDSPVDLLKVEVDLIARLGRIGEDGARIDDSLQVGVDLVPSKREVLRLGEEAEANRAAVEDGGLVKSLARIGQRSRVDEAGDLGRKATEGLDVISRR